MRTYEGMRLPPTTDPHTRNELLKVDKFLRALGPALRFAIEQGNQPRAVISGGSGPGGSSGSGGTTGDHNHSDVGQGGKIIGTPFSSILLYGQFGLNTQAASGFAPVLVDLKGISNTAIPLAVRRWGSAHIGPLIAAYDESGVLVFQFNVDATTYANIIIGGTGHSGSIGLADGATGYIGYFFPTVLSNDHSWVFPDEDGDVLLDYAIQTVGNKTLAITNLLQSNTVSSGVSFSDVNTASKQLRMILSPCTAGTNNALSFACTASRTYSFPNVTGQVVAVGNDPSPVAAGALGKEDLTAQAAAVAATNLTNGGLSGFYNVQYDLEVTTLQAGVGTVEMQVTYTDHIGATTQVGAAPLTLQALGRQRGCFQVWLNSGELGYQTNVVTQALARYALHVRVIYLG